MDEKLFIEKIDIDQCNTERFIAPFSRDLLIPVLLNSIFSFIQIYENTYRVEVLKYTF